MISVGGYVRIMRPKQWIKNLMLAIPPLFGGVMNEPDSIIRLALPFVAFCLASSAMYAVNDALDAPKDACHPVKKHRPIPSGAIRRPVAAIFGGGLGFLSLLLGAVVSKGYFLTLLGYVFVSSAYSIRLKEIPVVDLFCISAGFLLRLHAGGLAFGVAISDWLFLTIFLLSIFLSLGKRIAEKQILLDDCAQHRSVLLEYPLTYLHGTMYMTSAAVLVTYAMYVVNHSGMLYSVPLCCFGLFRFMYRVIRDSQGDPTEILLQDRVLSVVCLMWIAIVTISVYGNKF